MRGEGSGVRVKGYGLRVRGDDVGVRERGGVVEREAGDTHVPFRDRCFFTIGVEHCPFRIWTILLLFEADSFARAPPMSPPRGITAVPRLYIACAPRRSTRRILKLRAVPICTVFNLKTTT